MNKSAKSPFFSIIIPVYNVENFIELSLQSALNQSFRDIEVVCVDDCGSDGSMAIVEQMQSQDSRIKIVRHTENLGTFKARNTGAMNASGEYLFFLDGDDRLSMHTCLRCYGLINDDMLRGGGWI